MLSVKLYAIKLCVSNIIPLAHANSHMNFRPSYFAILLWYTNIFFENPPVQRQTRQQCYNKNKIKFQ